MQHHVSEGLIYQLFRQMLKEELRISKPDEIHVSEVVGCLRKAYYYRKYGDPLYLSHLADTKCVILGLGIAMHRGLQMQFIRLGYRVEVPVGVTIESEDGAFTLVGTPDVVGRDHIIELKTVNKIPERPYDHHVMQLNAYLWMTNRETGYIVYVCKKDGSVKVHMILRREKLWRKTIERAKLLYHCLKHDIVPPPEYSHLCKYCEFAFRCREDGDDFSLEG